MPGLEFSWAALTNATVGGLIGGAISFAFSWWFTQETRKRLELLIGFAENVTAYEYGREDGAPVIVEDPETGERRVGHWVVARRTFHSDAGGRAEPGDNDGSDEG